MNGSIKGTILDNVLVQENGIVRNKYGILIARLVDGITISNVNDYDKSIHSNPDADAWAKFYKQTYPDSDLETMRGWFANAMIAMSDYINQNERPSIID